MKMILKVVKQQYPLLATPCPWKGSIELKDFRFPLNAMQLLPSGIYRIQTNNSDDVDDYIFRMSFLIEVNHSWEIFKNLFKFDSYFENIFIINPENLWNFEIRKITNFYK